MEPVSKPSPYITSSLRNLPIYEFLYGKQFSLAMFYENWFKNVLQEMLTHRLRPFTPTLDVSNVLIVFNVAINSFMFLEANFVYANLFTSCRTDIIPVYILYRYGICDFFFENAA